MDHTYTTKLALVGLLLGISGTLRADDVRFVFEVIPPYERTQSSYTTTNDLPPAAAGDVARIFVTRAQYEAGFEALPPSVIVQAVADAKDYDADHANWEDKKLKALAKVLLDEINVLRQKAGLPRRTGTDMKAALRSQLAD